MATKWIVKDVETGWYFGRRAFRAIGDPPSSSRPLAPREEASQFSTKKAAQRKADELAAACKSAFAIERA